MGNYSAVSGSLLTNSAVTFYHSPKGKSFVFQRESFSHSFLWSNDMWLLLEGFFLTFVSNTVISKWNATFLKLPFFWRRVYTSESEVIHHFDNQDPMSGSVTRGHQGKCCVSFGKECMPMNLWLYITSVCQTPMSGQWHGGTRENGQVKVEKSVLLEWPTWQHVPEVSSRHDISATGTWHLIFKSSVWRLILGHPMVVRYPLPPLYNKNLF